MRPKGPEGPLIPFNSHMLILGGSTHEDVCASLRQLDSATLLKKFSAEYI